MSQQVDSQADRDFMAQMYGYAERKAVNGVYISNVKPLKGQRALILVALGEQADVINAILMKAAVPNDAALIERASSINDGKPF